MTLLFMGIFISRQSMESKMGLTTGGFIFMALAYSVIISVLVYSYYKLLTSKKSAKLKDESDKTL